MFNFYLQNKDNNSFDIDHVQRDVCSCKSDAEYRNSDEFNELCGNGLRSTSYCPLGGCQSQFDLSGIDGYGCWCNFGAQLTSGHGSPVNIFDDICKAFQLCLRCVKFDAATSLLDTKILKYIEKKN